MRFKLSCASGGAPRTKSARMIVAKDGDEHLEPIYEVEIDDIGELMSLMQEEGRPIILYGGDEKYDGELVVYDDYIE